MIVLLTGFGHILTLGFINRPEDSETGHNTNTSLCTGKTKVLFPASYDTLSKHNLSHMLSSYTVIQTEQYFVVYLVYWINNRYRCYRYPDATLGRNQLTYPTKVTAVQALVRVYTGFYGTEEDPKLRLALGWVSF